MFVMLLLLAVSLLPPPPAFPSTLLPCPCACNELHHTHTHTHAHTHTQLQEEPSTVDTKKPVIESITTYGIFFGNKVCVHGCVCVCAHARDCV